MIPGLMQKSPLMVTSMLAHGATYFPDVEVVSRTIEGPIHRYGYAEAERRSKRLAKALGRLGIEAGDRVGGTAWNHYRYFEAFFGVSGTGAVLHTVNPRLFPEQMAYVINHAGDRVMMVDIDCAGAIHDIRDQLKAVETYIILTDRENMPADVLPGALCYEDLLDAEDDGFDWPAFDENAASVVCYTSGTTGNPKGVVYSHRSSVLQAYACSMVDAFAIGSADTIMPVVPLFHGNAWSTPYVAPMCGAKYVLPGRDMDMARLHSLIVDEGVTISMAVPTIWIGMLQYLRETGQEIGRLNRIGSGGSAPPRAMMEGFETEHGVSMLHAWGMTETQAASTFTAVPPGVEGEQAMAIRSRQGRPIYGIELRVTDEDGAPLPWDGAAVGDIKARGHWVSSAYYGRDDVSAVDDEGWLITGDVGVIEPDGSLRLTDRSKDVIKSGGEWISSIDLENTAVGHPDLVEAAVIGVPDPRWQERPMLIAVPAPGSSVTAEEIKTWLAERVAKWWIPEKVVFTDELPFTGTGKINKMALREKFIEPEG
jgi:acyl-CoA synthetase (AMP-forming)/AMP-acid ligase II